MNILLSFTGFHDPFVPTAVEGEMETGPVLTVVAERQFDHIYLLSTPRLAEKTEETRKAIVERKAKTKVTVLDVPLKDPTNYLGILRQLRGHFKMIRAAHPDANYSISVSSGTPHMHASWILLSASGEIPATILQSTPPEFVPEGKPRVKEIDLTQPDFPQITRPIREAKSEDDETEVIAQACQELGIVGQDPAFIKALREAHVYSQYDDVHVLLLGETGSGKEYFARFIHNLSSRGSRALITINCSSIPENLVESQLFGHKRGAFTGASSDQQGKFKAADGGIIFLDEMGELPLNAQAKLLRVLEEGEIEPVGTNRPVKIDVKVIAATNRDLKAMVSEGTFRQDLYQRFGTSVNIPALRQRRIDIPQLALHILDSWNARHQKQRRLTTDALAKLSQYSWPGNVRELRKVITSKLFELRDNAERLRLDLNALKQREQPSYQTTLQSEIDALTSALHASQVPDYFKVAVVGQFKTGKSSFVNRLSEEKLAGVETNPETAAISIFRYGDEARAEVKLLRLHSDSSS